MDKRRLTLSVVVISWNQRDFLKRLVGQLLDQDYPHDLYEVIIADDGSTDGSREWLQSLSAVNIRYIFGSGNRGRAASRNAGIRAAKGEIIVMLDGDHTILPDYLSVHAARHAEERCVIVGKSDFVDDPDFRALNTYLNGGGAAKLPAHERLPGRYFLTRSCSIPKDLLLQVGMFDESFTTWGGEDLDLGVKLEKSGVPIYGESRCLAMHHHLRSLDDLLNIMYAYGRDSIPILLRRHPQLFEELSLHRTMRSPLENESGKTLARWAYRKLMTAPVYQTLRMTAHVLRRRPLPRFIFDFLHLRQYTRGYRDSLRST